jgi:hypothetical protein
MWAKQEERLMIPDGDTIKDKVITPILIFHVL